MRRKHLPVDDLEARLIRPATPEVWLTADERRELDRTFARDDWPAIRETLKQLDVPLSSHAAADGVIRTVQDAEELLVKQRRREVGWLLSRESGERPEWAVRNYEASVAGRFRLGWLRAR